jgi:hypothetical protein
MRGGLQGQSFIDNPGLQTLFLDRHAIFIVPIALARRVASSADQQSIAMPFNTRGLEDRSLKDCFAATRERLAPILVRAPTKIETLRLTLNANMHGRPIAIKIRQTCLTGIGNAIGLQKIARLDEASNVYVGCGYTGACA